MPNSKSSVTCPICHLDGQYVSKEPKTNGDYNLYNCGRCGKYKISRTAESLLKNQGGDFPALCSWTREQYEYKDELPFVMSYTLNSLTSISPDKNDNDKIKNLLRYINSKTENYGQEVLIVESFDYPVIWAANEMEFRSYLTHLIDEKYVVYADEGEFGDSFAYKVRITIKGRKKLEENGSQGIARHAQCKWSSVNEYLDEAYKNLTQDSNTATLKNSVHACREAIVCLANEVYTEEKHGAFKRMPSSYSNALTKLEFATGTLLSGGSQKEARSTVKTTIQHANKFAHAEIVEFSQAANCYSITKAIVEMIDTDTNNTLQ